jgi:uncharacterized protein YjhX (UPF0386 family)
MNGKKARQLRQLVRHLQDKGAIESKDWVAYGTRNRTLARTVRDEDGSLKEVRVPDTTIWLMPTCGKAIYKQMKKRHKPEVRSVAKRLLSEAEPPVM